MPLTNDQKTAVESRGGARLVSAAAGSGKTFVLVERLMRYVDDGHDIDRFMVVTYTRAAAGEMRSRILAALNERIAARPPDRRLRRQTELCCRASIGTIDSICGALLRRSAHAARIAPDFKVAEQDRAETMLAAALDDVLEEVYGSLDAHPERRALVDSFGAGRDDTTLSELVLQIYHAVQSHPHPELWLRQKRAALAVEGVEDAIATPWGAVLLRGVASQADYWAGRMESYLSQLLEPEREGLQKAYASRLAVAAEGLRAMGAAARESWDKARGVEVEFPRLGVYKGDDPLAESIKLAWKDCKSVCRDKWAPLLSDDSATLLSEIESTRPALGALLELVERLDTVYAERKRRAGLVDFSDQEHMVLRLLEDPDSGLAAELSARYDEVLVDEYQDVNECQDALFRLLSDGGRKLFMVGDVKQSIYRFRLADPTIFLDKYNRWGRVGPDTPEGEPGKILLRENFRSKSSILEAANHVFYNLMSPELGELRYDDEAALRAGVSEQAGGERVVFTMLDMAAETDDGPGKTVREAEYVAGQIRALLDAGTTVSDGHGGERKLRCGDIAVLLRSNKNVGERYRQALSARGIPAVSQQGGGFFRSLEITVLLALLAVVDNPRQDVALIAALRSPLYGFSPDDLADIRRYDKDHDFYTALTLASGDRPDAAAFLAELEAYRALAADLSVEDLLGRICERRDVYALLSAMPDGEDRRENVRALLHYARLFEQDGYRGTFRFLEWLQRLEKAGEEPRTGAVEARDAVLISSIHHSKGLEYPVVFLCDTTHRFNLRDSAAAVLSDPRLGVGGKVVDVRRGVRYPTLAWRAIARETKIKSLSEELRVLYVAMTRAKERLYITGTWADAEKAQRRFSEGLTSPLPPELLLTDGSMGDWLLRAALLPASPIVLRVESAAAAATPLPPLPAGEPLRVPETGEEAPAVRWAYPMEWASALPSKLTASALEGTDPDPDAASIAPETKRRAAPRRPRLDADAPLTAAERGTAVHTALQFVDFARCTTRQGIEEELAHLRAQGHLSPRQAEAVDPAMLERFFRSDTGRRALRAEGLWRELRFSLLTPAERFFPVPAGEQVLLQGVVDCCFLEDGALTVVDYKTDYVTPDTLAAKTAEYAPQVRVYAMALERMLGYPVKEGVLFFLRAGREARIALEGEDDHG